jgi:hypothetical protein
MAAGNGMCVWVKFKHVHLPFLAGNSQLNLSLHYQSRNVKKNNKNTNKKNENNKKYE